MRVDAIAGFVADRCQTYSCGRGAKRHYDYQAAWVAILPAPAALTATGPVSIIYSSVAPVGAERWWQPSTVDELA